MLHLKNARHSATVPQTSKSAGGRPSFGSRISIPAGLRQSNAPGTVTPSRFGNRRYSRFGNLRYAERVLSIFNPSPSILFSWTLDVEPEKCIVDAPCLDKRIDRIGFFLVLIRCQ
jgi:hypothetical protein